MDQEYIVIPGVRYTYYKYIKPDNSNKVFIKDCENGDLNALKNNTILMKLSNLIFMKLFKLV